MARVTMTIVHDQEYSHEALFLRAKGRDSFYSFFFFFLAREEHTKKIINRNLFLTVFVKINSPIDRAPPQENFPCRVFPTESVGISLQSSAATSYARSVVERSNNHLACFARALSEPRHATVAFS